MDDNPKKNTKEVLGIEIEEKEELTSDTLQELSNGKGEGEADG